MVAFWYKANLTNVKVLLEKFHYGGGFKVVEIRSAKNVPSLKVAVGGKVAKSKVKKIFQVLCEKVNFLGVWGGE